MSPRRKGQVFLKENGDVVLVSPPEFRAPSIRDTALALRAMGRKGIPLYPDADLLEQRETGAVEAVLADHALLALNLLEAIHGDDPAPLRAVVDAMKKTSKNLKPDLLTRAYCSAVRKLGGIPDDETIQSQFVALSGQSKTGACVKLDTLHGMLTVRSLEFTKSPRRAGRPPVP